MILSMNWLKDFIDIKFDNIKDFCEKMTMSGSKVETFSKLNEEIKNVIVGKIVKIEEHPDAERLFVCKLNIAAEENIQIITAASNIFEGALVPIALDNAKLANKVKIKKTKLRGIESNGMLCSIGELGLDISDFPNVSKDGILILHEECEVGQNILDVLKMNDIIIDFEITSNRQDCLSVLGMAREVSVTYNVPCKKPMLNKRYVSTTNDNFKVKIKADDLCSRYMAKVIKNVKIEQSPLWLRARLKACNIRPINNIVDITNYVMLEYGQPMHAFDYDKIDGSLIVRCADESEELVTLDGIQRKLNNFMLVVADENKPLAIAGVMGGQSSQITDTTKNIIFESATFNGINIRKTAQKLNLRSESSARFERGLSSFNCENAILRACELVEQLNAGEVDDIIVDINFDKKSAINIEFDCNFINNLLGTNLSECQIKEFLIKLGFKINGKFVQVPKFRTDVNCKADVAEEVARIYGYNNLPNVKLCTNSDAEFTDIQRFERKALEILTASGFYEIITYSMASPKDFEKLMLPQNAVERNCVKIKNPLGENTSVMRTNTISAMLEILAKNYNNKNEQVNLFDTGCEYIKKEFHDKNGKRLVDERMMLTLGLYDIKNKNLNFYSIKSVLENILSKLNIKNYKFIATTDLSYMHPGQTAEILIDKEKIGIIGRVHPNVIRNYELCENVFVAKLDFKKCFNLADKIITYKPISKYPAISRDLALICVESFSVYNLENIIKKSAGSVLESLELFDVYRGEQIPQSRKSVAYNLKFRSKEKTLKDSDVEKIICKILEALGKNGIILRQNK